MIKKILIIIVMLLLITACIKNEPVLVKKNTPPLNPNDEPELIEQSNEEEIEQLIEFSLPDEQVLVNINKVPILNEYLAAVSNRQKAIGEMEFIRIHQKDNSSIYLLEFSCENELCSYLLIDQSEGNPAYLVADLAKVMQTTLSPDNTKLLLHFNREAHLPLPLTNIIVIDIDKWELLPLVDDANNSNLLHYNWPFITVEWTDNETILATIPNILQPTSELIKQWQKEGKTTNVIFSTTNNH